jgi:hypothetical protein
MYADLQTDEALKMSCIESWQLLILLGVGLMSCAAVTLATDSLRIELNKLETEDSACRAYLVFENTTQHNFSGLTLDLVLFDKAGIVAKRLAVDAAPLLADKTSVKLFDIEGLACNSIGRMLINDALNCKDESGEIANCVAQIKPASRSDVPLVK